MFSNYNLIFLIIALIAACSFGFGITMARRCIERPSLHRRNKMQSALGSMPFWYVVLIALVVFRNSLATSLTISFFGGNAFLFAGFFTMLIAALQFELLGRLGNPRD
jgi:hypothetical protein